MSADVRTVNPGEAVTYHAMDATARVSPLKGAIDLMRNELADYEQKLALVLGLSPGTLSMMGMIYEVRNRLARVSSPLSPPDLASIAARLDALDTGTPAPISMANVIERLERLETAVGEQSQPRTDPRIGRLVEWRDDHESPPRVARVVSVEPGNMLLVREDSWGPSRVNHRLRGTDHANVFWPIVSHEDGSKFRAAMKAADPEFVITTAWRPEYADRSDLPDTEASHPDDAKCSRCDARLVFSARQRGDGLCGPCWRRERGELSATDKIADAAVQDRPLRPGDIWRDPEGTEYEVVRADDVGLQPRWWITGDTRSATVGLHRRSELHTMPDEDRKGWPHAIVEKRAVDPPEAEIAHINPSTGLPSLPPGLYSLTWRAGGTALAAVGMYRDGRRWFAPTSWAPEHVPSQDWALVESVEEVRR